jgi:hypothetical protein
MTRKHLLTAGLAAVSAAILATTAVSAAYGPWPWDVDWRHTAAWQHGVAKPRPNFAPPGCFIDRWVAIRHRVNWQQLYICR